MANEFGIPQIHLHQVDTRFDQAPSEVQEVGSRSLLESVAAGVSHGSRVAGGRVADGWRRIPFYQRRGGAGRFRCPPSTTHLGRKEAPISFACDGAVAR